MKIIIIAEEKRIAALLKHGLEEEKYLVDIALDSSNGCELVFNNNYDALIIDTAMSGLTGIAILKEIRLININIPIILLTPKYKTEDIVEALDLGADDIMAKPFSFDELAARLRAIMRRTARDINTKLVCGNLVLDTVTHLAYRYGKEIELTTREYTLLEYLMKNKNRILTRTSISQNVWKQPIDVTSNIVDVYIKRIRNKIEKKGTKKPLIQNIHGVGYRIREIND